MAVIWSVLNIRALNSGGNLWITVAFLLLFAYYQIISGLGKSSKFIEISQDSVRIKKNSLLPAQEYKATEIEKIDIYPLNIEFILKSGKASNVRFGTTFIDMIDPVKKKIEDFADLNNIPYGSLTEEV